MIDKPKTFIIKMPDGKIWDVPESALDTAIHRGGVEVKQESADTVDFFSTGEEKNNPVPQQPLQNKTQGIIMPDGKVWDVPEDKVKIALERGGKREEDLTYNDAGRFAARSTKTLGAAATGGLVDMATSVYNIPASIQNANDEINKQNNTMGEWDFIPPAQKEPIPLIPSAEHAIENVVDEATGGYTKTQEGDSIQAGLRMAGSIASPGGLAKGAAKAGAEKAATVLGGLGTTNLVGLGGAAVTGAVASEAEKAGYGGLASGAIGLGAGAATALAASLRPTHVKLALATLTGNSPKNINLETVAALESLGLESQNTLVNESNSLAMVDQFVSKAPITGSRQAKKNKKIDNSFAEAVEKSIAKVGEKIIDSDSALDTGTMAQETFVNIKDQIKIDSSVLYKNSENSLPANAVRVPHKMIIAIKKLRKGINTLDPSNDEITLMHHLDKIENQLYHTEEVAATKLAIDHNLELKQVPNDVKAMRTNKEIPVATLIGTKKSLNDTIDWDINAYGVKNKLKLVQRGLLDDIEAYGQTNTKWYPEFKEAEDFYGRYLGGKGLASKTFYKKIFSQEDPEKIIGSLSNISDFRKIGTVLEAAPAGQKFFDSLKREKLADLFMGKIIDPKTDTVTYTNFSQVLESRQNKELVKYLAGDNYSDLYKFSKIANANVRRSRRVPNPSGTAPTAKFLDHLEKIGIALAGAAYGASGGMAAIGAASGMAVTTAAASWLVNNKKALQWGIEAAIKQGAGKTKEAATISNRIERLMTQDMGEDFVRQFMALSSQD